MAPHGEVDTVVMEYRTLEAWRPSTYTWTTRHDGVADRRFHCEPLPPHGTVRWGDHGNVKVEVSLPVWAHGHNVVGVLADDAIPLLREVFHAATRIIASRGPFEETTLRRLDLPRDFLGVGSPDALLHGLSRVPATGRSQYRLDGDPLRGGALTLRKGNGSRSGTVYAKWGKFTVATTRRLRRKANDPSVTWSMPQIDRAAVAVLAEGRLRFEARVTDYHLRKTGMERVVDLHDGSCEAARRSIFEWCGFNRALGTLEAVTSEVNGTGGTAREKRELFSYLLGPVLGLDAPFGGTAAKRYRAISSRLGLAPLELFARRDSAVALDYDSGIVAGFPS